jgi:translation initiation factor IF-2
MTETNDQDRNKKTLSLSRPRLELKKAVETGQVRQSFPHGRTKTVTVEVKKTRKIATPATGKSAETKDDAAAHLEAAPAAEAAAKSRAAPPRTLTAEEKAARVRALEEAKRADEIARVAAEAEAERQAEEAARAKAEAEARARALAVEAKRREDAGLPPVQPEPAPETKPAPVEVVVEAKGAHPKVTPTAKPATVPVAPPKGKAGAAEEDEDEEAAGRAKRPGHVPAKRPAPTGTRRGEPRRRTGKLTISQALTEEERVRSLASVRRAREKEKQRLQGARTESTKVIRDVVVPETITVQELANRMAERGADVIKSLMRMGVMATINQVIDADTAELIVTEFGHKLRRVAEADVELGLRGDADDPAATPSRPPVVTIMGHVDHGKTSLLDALRSTDVASHEAGGITQHIGAYQVVLKNGQRITFIDTPGHEAFTQMRARGATVTDIVVLVVAADDGIMPQTIEAIAHATAAKVPVVVAINKMDKPGANPQRVRTELLNHGLVVEEMGGEILAIEVSAKAKTGLDKLEEAILLQAEILDLRANPRRPAEGVVIEAKLERGRGAVATVLVQRGTLRVGDIFVAGAEWGRVRALIDERGNPVDSAGPAAPVEVLGLNGAPLAGDEFAVVDSEGRARDVTTFRQRRTRDAQANAGARGTLEQMFSKIQAGEVRELAVVIKTDVQGSLEAIRTSLEKMATAEVAVRVLFAAVGGINESDVTLAKASGAMIIGFNVRANPQARDMAKRDGVEIRYYSIIYNVIEDVKAALTGMLSPTLRERQIGNAAIREVFNITKVGKVAGCRVTDGLIKRGAKVRILRDNVVIHEGTLKSLKHHKDEVREIKEGFECGMAFENFTDMQAGDVVECFEVDQITRSL